MQAAVPLACFLSMIRPPGVQYENALLQIAPVDKSKCPYVKDSNDVGFQLFTRHNPTAYQELKLDDDEKLFASNMDFNDKTVIYFHAWMEQPDDGSGIMVREAYMQRGDSNVIMVDAHHLEAGPWYFTAAQNTWYIGRYAALFVDYLASRGLNLNNTHLVGHSLGAHAAGVAGSALKSGRVSRITGLDPALPLFDNLPLEQRLDTTDAHFVDIIHTDAGIFGYKAPMGHVDFYPNGGLSPQPGCELEVVLPKQLLLNKCESPTQTRGFYSYYLTANQDSRLKRKTLESKLENLFAFIQTVKTKTVENDVKKENGTKKDKLDKEYHHVDNNTKITLTHNISKTTDVDINQDKPFANKSSGKLNDSIKDILIKDDDDKTVDYVEDQIAEASEFDITQLEYNRGELKNKETVSLIKDSEEMVLEDDTKMVNNEIFRHDNEREIISNNDKVSDIDKDVSTKPITNTKQSQDNEKVKKIQTIENAQIKSSEKEDMTMFTLFNADFESEDGTEGTLGDLSDKQKDKRESGTTILDYKDPCEPKKVVSQYTTENVEIDYDTEILPQEVKKPKEGDKLKDKPNQINILNVLGTTYRISRVISNLKGNKDTVNDKIKKLFTKKTESTTPSFIENLFLDRNGRTNHVVKRQKRFLPFFKNGEGDNSNILFRMLDFLIKNRKNVLPVLTVMREINTLVKSGKGELNHYTKEQNNYIGATPPVFTPITYNLELGNENRAVAFVKRLLGMSPKGDRLTISGRK